MRPEIKFCGVTRATDAAEAARLGARYVGAIFARSPRLVTHEQARDNFRALPATVRRVGVFGEAPAVDVAAIAHDAELDIIQLHGDPDVHAVDRLRRHSALEVWAVARVNETCRPGDLSELAAAADALVLDTKVDGHLGGTGRPLHWPSLVRALEPLHGRGRIVLAGGLTSGNVGRAIEVLRPDVVDVSSGVESAPGIKDHARMRAFTEAVRQAGATR